MKFQELHFNISPLPNEIARFESIGIYFNLAYSALFLCHIVDAILFCVAFCFRLRKATVKGNLLNICIVYSKRKDAASNIPSHFTSGL